MPTADSRVRVVIADDHPFFRDGVSRGMSRDGRIEVVAEAEDGREALDAIRRDRPDVALIDYQMPGLDGLAIVRAVVRDQLPTRVLLLSAYTDSGLVFDALRRRQSAAWLMEEATPRAILFGALKLERGMGPDAIRKLADGGRFAPAPPTAAARSDTPSFSYSR